MSLSVERLESTDLFVGSEEKPRQVLKVCLGGDSALAATVVIDGGASGSAPVPAGATVVEVGVEVPAGTAVGAVLAVHARVLDEAGDVLAEAGGELTVEAPGWTMWMVSHFHYDPVWWNTQAAYTSEWDLLPDAQASRTPDQFTGFALVDAHLDLALAEPSTGSSWPSWTISSPIGTRGPTGGPRCGSCWRRAGSSSSAAPTTSRTPTSPARRPRSGRWSTASAGSATSWPAAGPVPRPPPGSSTCSGTTRQFPSMVADAGLTSSSWARGPHHQWGPLVSPEQGGLGTARVMQFASEFEWVGPDGRGILTSYMPAHYSAGWDLDSAASLEQAEERAYAHFANLKPVALTRNILLPVGTDYTPPAAWIIALHRDWNSRYVWPAVRLRLPREFFAAVRSELSRRELTASPQTRDMNPVYTGKEVSYIDTKQAQRACENAVGTRRSWRRSPRWPVAPGTRRRRWTRPGASWRSARITTRSPGRSPTRSISTCSRAGGTPTIWASRCGIGRRRIWSRASTPGSERPVTRASWS